MGSWRQELDKSDSRIKWRLDVWKWISGLGGFPLGPFLCRSGYHCSGALAVPLDYTLDACLGLCQMRTFQIGWRGKILRHISPELEVIYDSAH